MPENCQTKIKVMMILPVPGDLPVTDFPGKLEVKMVGEDVEDHTLFHYEGDNAEPEQNQYLTITTNTIFVP